MAKLFDQLQADEAIAAMEFKESFLEWPNRTDRGTVRLRKADCKFDHVERETAAGYYLKVDDEIYVDVDVDDLLVSRLGIEGGCEELEHHIKPFAFDYYVDLEPTLEELQ